MRKLIRKLLFNYCFSEHEKTVIINSLYRNSYGRTTDKSTEGAALRATCKRLATEFMEY